MTFQDIFKNSFLEGYAQSQLTPTSIAYCLLIAALIGIYIFAAYRILCRKSFFNKNFSISLIAIAVITAAIILTVQSNVVLSLGMVGALSIVRFRTAIKDPMDLAFLFWSISIGIICGAGIAAIAVILSLVMTAVILIFNLIPIAKAPMLLLVSSENLKDEKKIMAEVSKYARGAAVKSRTLTKGQIDLVIELRRAKEAELSASLMELEGITSVSIVAHDGEVTF